MSELTAANDGANIDWFIFFASAFVVVAACVPLALYPEQGAVVLNDAFTYVTQELGVIYILFSIMAISLLLYLAFSRFGDVVLGGNGVPDFSTFSWAAMLFCGGIGTSVLYWGTIEWAHYYQAPPMGVESLTPEALQWAGAYPIFHWGFTGWALYCLPAVAVAYAYHVRGVASLTLSAACEPIIGKWASRLPGRIIDITYTVGLIGACSTGIGLAVPLIAACLGWMFDLQDTFALKVVVICVITAVFVVSVWIGLERGIKRLSNLAVWLAFGLLVFVLVVGPTVFILESGTATFGFMLQNFVTMSTWTDPGAGSNFVESWTVFYWAWWLALGPFMGIFITKISGGRTIKQVILGSLGYGTLGTTLFFVILGGYAVHLELSGQYGVLSQLNNSAAGAVVGVITSLPLNWIVLPIFCLVCIIFAATSYDSASYTLASSTTRALPRDAHPARWNRVFWAVALGLLPITLIQIGGLRPLQSAVVAVSVPLLVVVSMTTLGLWKSLHDDEAQTLGEKTLGEKALAHKASADALG
ncbi:MAG: BCCT family betaine/carnitine transporter [Limisphaerales bacterium]